MLTVGSLFSGIGGFDLGLERAGMRTLWFCEQDEFCQRVLGRHWPGVPCHPDVRALVADACVSGRREGSRELGGVRAEKRSARQGMQVQVPSVDVLCGGFPCQDISLAGKGAGIEGERSGLWGEYARLVGELRPRYVIVENVAALLGRGLERVLGDLAALGYDAEWDCLPASAFGAPHRRDRLWLVAYPATGVEHERGREGTSDDDPQGPMADAAGSGRSGGADRDAGDRGEWPPSERVEGVGEPAGSGRVLADTDASAGTGTGTAGEPLHGPEAVERSGRRGGGAGRHVADAEQPGLEGHRERPLRQGPAAGGGAGSGELQDADERALQPWRVGGRAAQAGGPEWWAVEPPVGRVAHGVPDRLDQLASLGNALVPQIAEWIGRRIVSYELGEHPGPPSHQPTDARDKPKHHSVRDRREV